MAQADDSPQLEERFFVTRAAQLRRWLPWLTLFRSFRMALGLRRMMLALVALCLWTGVVRGFYSLRQFLHDGPAATPVLHWENPSISDIYIHDSFIEVGPFRFHPASWARRLEKASGGPDNPTSLPALRLIALGQWLWPGQIVNLYTFTVFLVSLLTCGLFGGAICRMTAVQYSGQGDVPLLSAVKYSAIRLPATLGAPLTAWVAGGIFWLCAVLLGLLVYVPYIGEFMLGLLWFIPLLLALLRGLVLVGVTAGWPLMAAAVNVERTDAFDALSRAYSYLFNRFWNALFLISVAIVFGAICWLLVWYLMMLTLSLNYSALSTVISQETLAGLDSAAMPAASLGDVSPTAALCVAVWLFLLRMIPEAFLFSYFWVAVTIIYFLLRQAEDGTPLDEVDLAGVTTTNPLPLAGIPRARQREKTLAIVHPDPPAASP